MLQLIETRAARHRAGRGSILAVFILLIPTAAAAFYGGMLFEQNRSVAAGDQSSDATSQHSEALGAPADNYDPSVDPFEGVEAFEAPSGWGTQDRTKYDRWKSLCSDPAWHRAVDAARRADDLIEKSERLHTAGDSEWRDLLRSARDELETALADTETLVEELELKGIPLSRRRDVSALRDDWQRSTASLRKSVGF